jgi:hypothetical protein
MTRLSAYQLMLLRRLNHSGRHHYFASSSLRATTSPTGYGFTPVASIFIIFRPGPLSGVSLAVAKITRYWHKSVGPSRSLRVKSHFDILKNMNCFFVPLVLIVQLCDPKLSYFVNILVVFLVRPRCYNRYSITFVLELRCCLIPRLGEPQLEWP